MGKRATWNGSRSLCLCALKSIQVDLQSLFHLIKRILSVCWGITAFACIRLSSRRSLQIWVGTTYLLQNKIRRWHRFYLFGIYWYLPQSVLHPAWTWLMQVNSQTAQSSQVEFSIEKFDTYYVPVLCVTFIVCVFHEFVVFKNGDPISLVAHFFSVVCWSCMGSRWRYELLDRNGIWIIVLKGHIWEKCNITDLCEG
jgi:hypothetical protein